MLKILGGHVPLCPPLFLRACCNMCVFIISAFHLWTHKKLEIGYNGKHIVDVNLTSDVKVELKAEAKIPFSFEVVWKESKVKFADRFDKYLDPNFFQHRVSKILPPELSYI